MVEEKHGLFGRKTHAEPVVEEKSGLFGHKKRTSIDDSRTTTKTGMFNRTRSISPEGRTRSGSLGGGGGLFSK